MKRWASVGLLAAGGLLLALAVVPSLHGRLAAPRVGASAQVSGPFFLVSATTATECAVRPATGAPRTVPVPPSGRVTMLPGTSVDPWYPGAATVTCDDGDVRAQSGLPARLGWFARHEFPVVLLAAAALAVGWVYRPQP